MTLGKIDSHGRTLRARRVNLRDLLLTPKGFAQLCGGLVALFGITSTLGWLFGIEVLRNPPPSELATRPNTALCLALAGAGLFLLDGGHPVRRRAVDALAWLLLAIALATLSQHLFGWNAHIDELLAR